MDKVKSLMKETKQKRAFSKLKINFGDSLDKSIDKIVKHIAKDIEGVNAVDIKQYMKFKNFNLSEAEKLSEKESNTIRNGFFKKDRKNFYQGYDLAIEDRNLNYLNVLTIPTVELSSRARKGLWKFTNTGRKGLRICDIKYLYGMLKLLDMTYEYCFENKEIFSEEFKQVSMFKKNYTIDKAIELIEIDKFIGKNSTFKVPYNMMELIVDVVISMKFTEYNIELMEKYDRDMQSEVARAYETKKNIPAKVLDVMENNKFLENFSYVELDSDTDLEKFKRVESEFLRIRKVFNMDKVKKAEFRVRKLGKHKALGIYFPSLKCLCVDITSPSSFIHEFAHHIDYTYEEKPLSLKNDFRAIINEYTIIYDKYLDQNEEESYLRRKRSYYTTPTEIFARCFEIYLVEKGIKTSFLKDKKDMNITNGYVGMNDEKFKKFIAQYFNNKLTLNFETFKEVEVIKEVKQISKAIVEEIKYSKLEQIGFVI